MYEHAGYGWQIGFYFEVAWQCFFVMDTVASLWVCAFLLLGAFLVTAAIAVLFNLITDLVYTLVDPRIET